MSTHRCAILQSGKATSAHTRTNRRRIDVRCRCWVATNASRLRLLPRCKSGRLVAFSSNLFFVLLCFLSLECAQSTDANQTLVEIRQRRLHNRVEARARSRCTSDEPFHTTAIFFKRARRSGCWQVDAAAFASTTTAFCQLIGALDFCAANFIWLRSFSLSLIAWIGSFFHVSRKKTDFLACRRWPTLPACASQTIACFECRCFCSLVSVAPDVDFGLFLVCEQGA